LAAVALWAGVLVSGAKAAAPLCGSKQCAEEIAAGCAGLSGAALKACKSAILDQCKTGTCTCTGQPGLPECPVTTTTSSTTTTLPQPPCGTFLLTWGVPSGTGNGELTSPAGVATDASGNVYVVDSGNSRIQKFDASGNFLTTWGSSGGGMAGLFQNPKGVATDGSGNVYVADTGNDRIQKFACP